MSGLWKLTAKTESSQALLNMAIYQEKNLQTAHQKVLQAQKAASAAWSDYGASDANPVVQQLMAQVTMIQQLYIRAQEEFVQQNASYRNLFLEVLKGDKVIAEMQKTVDDYTPKILKLEKQLESVTAKGKDRKSEALTLEVGKYLTLKKNAEKELKSRKENHESYKLRTIKNAVLVVTNAQIKLHEMSHEMFQTQRLILDYYTALTASPDQTAHIHHAQANSDGLISHLRRKLDIDSIDNPPTEGGRSQANLDETVFGNLADVLGTPLMQSQSTIAEQEATYNPIPDIDSETELPLRKGSKERGRPLPATPGRIHSEQHKCPPDLAPPPIPPRKDLTQNDIQGSEYLDMEADTDMWRNSVYQSSPDTTPYYLLANTTSGSKNSSIKSQASTTSHSDSGLESRASTKSDSSQTAEEVYEILDSRFTRKSSVEKNDVYEL